MEGSPLFKTFEGSGIIDDGPYFFQVILMECVLLGKIDEFVHGPPNSGKNSSPL
jgi:hypothetical protein